MCEGCNSLWWKEPNILVSVGYSHLLPSYSIQVSNFFPEPVQSYMKVWEGISGLKTWEDTCGMDRIRSFCVHYLEAHYEWATSSVTSQFYLDFIRRNQEGINSLNQNKFPTLLGVVYYAWLSIYQAASTSLHFILFQKLYYTFCFRFIVNPWGTPLSSSPPPLRANENGVSSTDRLS